MSHKNIAPLSQETFEAFSKMMQIYIRLHHEFMEEWKGRDHFYKRDVGNNVEEKNIPELFKQLQTLDRWPKQTVSFLSGLINQNDEIKQAYEEFIACPDVELLHVFRLFMITHEKKYSEQNLFRILSWNIWQTFEKTHCGSLTFTSLGNVLRRLGMDDQLPGRQYIGNGLIVEEENLSYYFDHPQLLLDALTEEKGSWFLTEQKRVTLQVIQKMPSIPDDILQVVWDYALSEAKTLRLDAQTVLDPLPETLPKILDALKSSKAGTRSVAAQWLTRLRKPEFVKPLRDGLAKEKTDSVRIDLMKALVSYDVSLDDLLDRDELIKEAEKALKKVKFDESPPKALVWFPFDKMPALHWNDDTAVDPRILKHWLVQAVKMKTPEPNPLIMFYGQQMNRSECETAARFVLENWIAEDVRPGTEEEAQKKARDFCTVVFGGQASPQDYQKILDSMRIAPIGSANDSKGILGLVAAWGDESLPAIMEKYVRDWYGNRVHQSRALVVALGGMENTAAIQALLSISRKMKTKSIREEAENAVKNLAERKNWSLDQLADRTAPTAGLDEHREIVFDLGARKITARWTTEPKLFPYDESGKQLKVFPGQLKSDDETLYAEAKKMFQAANKLLKTTVTQQTERLYEAMCAGRTWTFDEWSLYILRHAVLGRLACGLVWGVFEADTETPSKIFRPLEDGSLTDVDDNSVELAETDQIRIVHSLNLTPEQIAAWTQHLNDYEVKPLFSQFGRTPYLLPDEKCRETRITDFYGSKVMAYNLRSLALKHGFVRGETGDGGWFYEYLKPMQGLELSVVIEFSGNGLPEENNEVELYHLAFRTKTGRELSLEKVPSILLSEMYRTLETLVGKTR